jgi:hypothetical protein
MPRHAAATDFIASVMVNQDEDAPLDAAARAAYVAHYAAMGLDVQDPEHGVPWERLHPGIKNRFYCVARAAIDAYHDPQP